MSREEIQKLLGGYATDTLSAAERRELLEAALEDQELFDALAKEQGLRDVLQDPAARRQLIGALTPPRKWIWLRRPATLAMAGGLATLVIVAGVWMLRSRTPARQETIVAEVTAPRQSVPLPSAAPAVVQRPAVRRKPTGGGGGGTAPAPRTAAPVLDQKLAQEVVAESRPAPAAPPPAPAVLPVGQNVVNAPAAELMTKKLTAMAGTMRAKAALGGSPTSLQIPYQLLLANPDGTYAPAAAGTVFRAGDSVRLQVQPPNAGYLSLYRRQADGGLNLVAGQPVESTQQYVLPVSGGLQSAQPGQMELILMLAPQAQSAMRFQSADSAAPAGAPIQAVRKITLEFR